jgi:hypothetical protein
VIQIHLRGADAGYEAAEWCDQNLNKEHWGLWLENAWGDYLFEFKSPKDATLFSLTWSEHTIL